MLFSFLFDLVSSLELYFVRKIYHKWIHPENLPTKVRIDASTMCQLRCEGCGFQKSNHRGLGGGFLRLKDFEAFLQDNPQIERVELSNYGEIFLNPELIPIMKCAFEHSVSLTAEMGVNFNHVTPEQLNALIDYQFSYLSISIDGASQNTYAQYRIGGNFDRVMENLKKLQDLKRIRNSHKPELRWQYVINQYNEKEIALAKKMAEELEIPIYFKLNFMKSYIPVHEKLIHQETGLECITRDEYLQKYKLPYLNEDCLQIFNDPQFNWDGNLLGCCRVETAIYGTNLFHDGLKAALISDNFIRTKELLLQKFPSKKRYSDLYCWNCQLRKGRAKFLKRLELPKT